jgi:hypothetical protein
MATPIKSYKITELCLDSENPRLPEAVMEGQQSAVLEYLFSHMNLSELAQSYLDNGFFVHEPLIILKDKTDGKHTVLEGNRRLAALMVLHGLPEAGELRFLEIEPTKEQLDSLKTVPCLAIASRDEVHRFLGFRHIGGIKTWDPDAKARYLRAEVERAVGRGATDPFKEVGRQVGSNALGVRNPYLAIAALLQARDEYGIDVTSVQQDRFGVWLRCMNSKEIRTYIGLDSPRTYHEIQQQLRLLREPALREVVADFSPKEGSRKALLSDSRQVTDYGRVLMNEDARAALRKYGSIELAAQLVERAGLAARIAELVTNCKILLEQLPLAEPTKELVEVTEQLALMARSMHDVVKGRVEARG